MATRRLHKEINIIARMRLVGKTRMNVMNRITGMTVMTGR